LNKIGVVTVNYRSLQYTLQFVEGISKSIKDYLLIVVNNSPEDTQKLKELESKEVILINSKKNSGYSGGLNLGLKYLQKNTNCEWFLIGNNDVIIDDEFISEIGKLTDKDTIYSPVIMNVGNDIVQNTGGDIGILYGGTINVNKGKHISEIKKTQPDFLSGCFLYFHKNVLDKVGYFDESYESYFEDVDHSMSTKDNTGKKDFLIARNAIYFAKKDLNGIKKYLFIFFSILVGFFWVLPRPKNLPYFFRGVKEGLL